MTEGTLTKAANDTAGCFNLSADDDYVAPDNEVKDSSRVGFLGAAPSSPCTAILVNLPPHAAMTWKENYVVFKADNRREDSTM